MKLKIILWPAGLSEVTWTTVAALFVLMTTSFGCKKFVQAEEPVNTITTAETFASDANATSAVVAIYSKLINAGTTPNFGSGALSVYCGLSSDELLYFNSNTITQFATNALQSNNSLVLSDFWTPAYFAIYQANAAIAGLSASTGVDDSTKNELTGEALFARAFCYFYLVNLFGDVPLVLTTDFNQTALLTRTPQAQVYQQIITDLKAAQTLLPSDYSAGGGQRILPNKWAATALLARVYLYTGDYPDAEVQSTSVIGNSGLFSLESNLNNAFLITSTEAILQLQHTNTINPYTATIEGYSFIPTSSTVAPSYYLTAQLLNSFEPNDQRAIDWIKQSTYSGTTYSYPYKYKVRLGTSGGTYTEYEMVLRLAEQYLIRAEARAQQGDTSEAAADLNVIRNRSGLANVSYSTAASLLTAVYHERQVELFAEWGHRWLDLKRTGQATTVLSADKGFTVTGNDLLYPIPYSELSVDPNLTQNLGY